MFVAFGLLITAATGASAEVRSLKLHHLHTGEEAEIVFKRNGRYDREGLRKINIILRDWRRNEPTNMDPRLLDLVWETYKASGATGYIQVVCGYRSPATNSMLRRRSRGVAKESQHMLGKALDFFIPGVPLKKVRDIGLRMQGGGVGYYPASGSPFVHFDTGNVRHWPGISRQELVRLFPDGKTLHVPSDGRPLPGYEQAVAAYKARKGAGATIELASAGGSTRKSGGLLAALFGGGSDQADDSADVAAAAPAPKTTVKTAAATKRSNLPVADTVAPQDEPRQEAPQVAEPQTQEAEKDTPETVIAALPASRIPLPGVAPRPKTDAQQSEDVPSTVADASETTEQAVATAHAPTDIPAGMSDPMSTGAVDPAQVAINNIPVPTWRPDGSLPANLAPKDRDVLLALADTSQHNKSATDALSEPPPERHDEVKAVLEHAGGVSEANVTGSVYQLASLEPSPGISASSGAGTVSPNSADPTPASGAGVKTTRKEARASARDPDHGPKVMVVATPPQAARWALGSGENIASVSSPTTAPRYAYNIVHTPPSEVYTAGFQTNSQLPDTSRFTGNAVKFLSVARFEAK